MKRKYEFVSIEMNKFFTVLYYLKKEIDVFRNVSLGISGYQGETMYFCILSKFFNIYSDKFSIDCFISMA